MTQRFLLINNNCSPTREQIDHSDREVGEFFLSKVTHNMSREYANHCIAVNTGKYAAQWLVEPGFDQTIASHAWMLDQAGYSYRYFSE